LPLFDEAIGAAIVLAARHAAADMADAARRTARDAALRGLAAGLCLGALGCAVAGLWIVAIPWLGPGGAAFAAAFCLLLVAGLVLLVVALDSRRRRDAAPSALSAAVLAGAASRLFRENTATIVLAALVAGLLAGNDRKGR